MKKKLTAALISAFLMLSAACPVLASGNESEAVQTGDATKTLLIVAGVVILVAVVALVLTNVMMKKK